MIATPNYDRLHGGHNRTDPRYATTGYDVIRSTVLENGWLILTVTDVIEGATNYLEALELAKAHRVPGHYGYTADRYACGCRWIANNIDGERITFTDYDAEITR